MSIRNKIYLWRPLKRLRQKKCDNCIYAFKHGRIFACYRTYKKWNNLKLLAPLRLICFRKKVKTNDK